MCGTYLVAVMDIVLVTIVILILVFLFLSIGLQSGEKFITFL